MKLKWHHFERGYYRAGPCFFGFFFANPKWVALGLALRVTWDVDDYLDQTYRQVYIETRVWNMEVSIGFSFTWNEATR